MKVVFKQINHWNIDECNLVELRAIVKLIAEKTFDKTIELKVYEDIAHFNSYLQTDWF